MLGSGATTCQKTQTSKWNWPKFADQVRCRPCQTSDSGEEELPEAVDPVLPALVSVDMYVVARELMSLSSQDLWGNGSICKL